MKIREGSYRYQFVNINAAYDMRFNDNRYMPRHQNISLIKGGNNHINYNAFVFEFAMYLIRVNYDAFNFNAIDYLYNNHRF